MWRASIYTATSFIITMSASGGQCFRQEDLSCTFLLPSYVQSRKAAFSNPASLDITEFLVLQPPPFGFCFFFFCLFLKKKRGSGTALLWRLDEINLFLHSSSRHTLLPLPTGNEEKLARRLMPTVSQFPEQVEGIYLCKHNPLCLWNSEQHFASPAKRRRPG